MARRKKTTAIADIDKKIRQWQTKFTRAMNAISKLNAQRKRLEKAERMAKMEARYLPGGALRPEHYPVGGMSVAIARPEFAETVSGKSEIAIALQPQPTIREMEQAVYEAGAKAVGITPVPPAKDDGLDVPDFLRRDTARKLDTVEADLIKAEVEAKRLAKSRGRIAKMKAKKAGDTKRMPLTGKAASDFINNG